jgi:hypothetical protein
VFATRHPDRDQFLSTIAADVGTLPFLIPPRGVGFRTPRSVPAITRADDVHVAADPRDRMPGGYRTLPATDLISDCETVTAPDGSWRVPLAHLLWMPMLLAGVHAYDPFPAAPGGGRGARITIGRTVWRRETWHIPPADGPACPQVAASWARDLGLPGRVFALSPGEVKPIYIDFDSPVLTRVLCRQLRRAAGDFPGQLVRFVEQDFWRKKRDNQPDEPERREAKVELDQKYRSSRVTGEVLTGCRWG